eukprot:gene14313-21947_t
MELMKEPTGVERHSNETWGKGTMRDRKSEVVIFCTDVKENFQKWERFLSERDVVKTTRTQVARMMDDGEEDKQAARELREEVAVLQRRLREKDAAMKRTVATLEETYGAQLDNVVSRGDHERQVEQYSAQKRELQKREAEFQEGLGLAKATIDTLRADVADLEAKRLQDIARLEEIIQNQEREKAALKAKLRGASAGRSTRVSCSPDPHSALNVETTATTAISHDASFQELKAILKEKAQETADLTAKNARLTRQVAALMGEVTSAASGGGRGGGESVLAVMESERLELEKEAAELAESLRLAHEELEDKDARISLAGAALKNANVENEKLKRHASEVQGDLLDATRLLHAVFTMLDTRKFDDSLLSMDNDDVSPHAHPHSNQQPFKTVADYTERIPELLSRVLGDLAAASLSPQRERSASVQRDTVTLLEQQSDALKDENDDLQAELLAVRAEAGALKERNSSLQRELEDAMQLTSGCDDSMRSSASERGDASWRDEALKLRSRVASLTKEILERSADDSETIQLRAAMSNLTEALHASHESEADKERQLARLSDDVIVKTKETVALQEQLFGSEKSLRLAQQQVDRLAAREQSGKEALLRLENQLSKMVLDTAATADYSDPTSSATLSLADLVQSIRQQAETYRLKFEAQTQKTHALETKLTGLLQ